MKTTCCYFIGLIIFCGCIRNNSSRDAQNLIDSTEIGKNVEGSSANTPSNVRWSVSKETAQKLDGLRYVINNLQRQDNQDIPLFNALADGLESQIKKTGEATDLAEEQTRFLDSELDGMKQNCRLLRSANIDSCREGYKLVSEKLAIIQSHLDF